MGKKRILVVTQHYWPENFRITDICEGFVEKGCEVDVLCGLPNYPKGFLFDGYSYFKPRRQQKNGVNIYRCGEILRKGNSSARIFLNYISFPVSAFFNLCRLWGKKYDAVFSYETSPVLMLWPAIVRAKLSRTPLTCYVLDLWPENLYSVLDVKSRFLRKICKSVSDWHYKRCDKLIAMSPALQNRLIEVTGKDSGKVYCIPHFCESLYEKKVHSDELEKRFAGKFNILFAGNFSPAQGLEVLIAVAEHLKADKINGIHFIMVGDGMSHADFVAEAERNGVSDYFTFEGQKPVTDIPMYQTAADALFAGLAKTASLELTIPAKVTSYIAAQKPILLCMNGAGAQMINEAQCGICVSAGDADGLYSAVMRLYGMTDAERRVMCENARLYHEKYLKRDIVLDKLLQAVFE